MKAYLATVLILDHEGYGMEDAKISLSQLRHWHPSVISCKEAEIGEWSDDHPLNYRTTQKAECNRLFSLDSQPTSPISEIIVWVDYSSMDTYPREAYLTMEGARNKVSWLTLDPNDEDYDEEIANAWKAFEQGARSFVCEEVEFHRVMIK